MPKKEGRRKAEGEAESEGGRGKRARGGVVAPAPPPPATSSPPLPPAEIASVSAGVTTSSVGVGGEGTRSSQLSWQGPRNTIVREMDSNGNPTETICEHLVVTVLKKATELGIPKMKPNSNGISAKWLLVQDYLRALKVVLDGEVQSLPGSDDAKADGIKRGCKRFLIDYRAKLESGKDVGPGLQIRSGTKKEITLDANEAEAFHLYTSQEFPVPASEKAKKAGKAAIDDAMELKSGSSDTESGTATDKVLTTLKFVSDSTSKMLKGFEELAATIRGSATLETTSLADITTEKLALIAVECLGSGPRGNLAATLIQEKGVVGIDLQCSNAELVDVYGLDAIEWNRIRNFVLRK